MIVNNIAKLFSGYFLACAGIGLSITENDRDEHVNNFKTNCDIYI